jgi:hypothetical protein
MIIKLNSSLQFISVLYFNELTQRPQGPVTVSTRRENKYKKNTENKWKQNQAKYVWSV